MTTRLNDERQPMATYVSDIVLGEEYRHTRTGAKGHATAIYFFENACERVTMIYFHDGDIKEATFDSVELEHVATEKVATSPRKGGTRGPSGTAAARGAR